MSGQPTGEELIRGDSIIPSCHLKWLSYLSSKIWNNDNV